MSLCRSYFGDSFPTPGVAVQTPVESSFSPSSGPSNYEPSSKLPHVSRLAFPDSFLSRSECHSPIPRRKQARPRRRSGEMCGPQDLTKPSPPPPMEEPAAPENLCMKKNKDEKSSSVKEEDVKVRTPDISRSPEIDLHSVRGGGGIASNNKADYRTSPPITMRSALNMKQEIDSHSPLPFPPMPSVSALAMTPSHSKCKYRFIFIIFVAMQN